MRTEKYSGNRRSRLRLFLLSGLLLLCLLAAGALVWWEGGFLPGWTRWQNREFLADLDGDGGMERLRLDGSRRLRIRKDGALFYESDRSWKVFDAMSGDLNGDGTEELILLVWKHGSYGKHRPMWVTWDPPVFSQHVFIFQAREGEMRPVWMSSAFGGEIAEGWLDADRRLHLMAPDGSETVWGWLSWGLQLVGEHPQPTGSLDLLAAGDNIVYESTYRTCCDLVSGTFDFRPIYRNVREMIRRADLAAVTQETPLVAEPWMYSSYPRFGTPEAAGHALADTGFDLILHATNHVNDKGEEGLENTLRFWKQYPEIAVLGLHETEEESRKVRYLGKNGIRLALFDYTFGTNGLEPEEGKEYRIDVLTKKEQLLRGLSEAEGMADCSVVFLHIGEEYQREPAEEQKVLCAELTDAGADAVICSHSHVLQPWERLRTEAGNESVVFYGLGNFMAVQPRPETILGGLAELRIEKGIRDGKAETEITSCSVTPVVSHVEQGTVTLYPLEDYSEELLEKHFVNREEPRISWKELQQLWEEVLQESREALQDS